MRKKVDSRIRTLVERCVALRHRSLFVIVGDKGRDQARRHTTPTPEVCTRACLNTEKLPAARSGGHAAACKSRSSASRYELSLSVPAKDMQASTEPHLVMKLPAQHA